MIHQIVRLSAMVSVAALLVPPHGSLRPDAVRLDGALSYTDADDVLHAAADAIGGLERLRAVGTVRVEEQGLEYLITIGSPVAPNRFGVAKLASLMRTAPVGLRRTVEQAFPMRSGAFTQTTVMNGDVVEVVRAARTMPGGAADLAAASEEVDLAPHRVLLTALDAPGRRLERDSTIGPSRYHIVSFPWGGGHVQLAINVQTGFPERLRLVRDYSSLIYWAMWGRVAIETTWSSWSLEPNGIWYPRQRTTTFNGEPYRTLMVTNLDFAPVAPADSFAISDSIVAAFKANARTATPEPTLKPVSIADGIVLFEGGYQTALVREAHGVIVVEAPESDAKSRAVLAQSARLFPGVPITAVVTTTAPWIHVGGLAEYARRGIPIYALDVNGPEVRALLAAAHVSGSARVTLVHDVITLGEGANRVQLIPARGEQSADMMILYWPAHHLLYASDLIIPPAFEPIFTAAYTAELRRTVDRLRLSVSTVFALHLPPALLPPAPVAGTPDSTIHTGHL